MFTNQEKTYQKIESLFSKFQKPFLSSNKTEETEEIKEMENGEDIENGKENGEHPEVLKKSIEIECQGKKYAYHLEEVLRKKWNVWEALHDTSESNWTKEIPQTNKSGFLFRGGDDIGAVENTPSIQEENKESFVLKFCFFTIETRTIVPFLKFFLVSGEEENILSFPKTSFVPSSDKNVDIVEEEEHAEFLDACRKKFMEMGIFKEEQEEAFTTEFMERNYHGYIMSPEENRTAYVFFQWKLPSEIKGIYAIVDEIINRGKVLEQSVDTRLRPLFYSHPEILYIYGSSVNPIESVLYGKESKYDSSNETAQEIPYCLYLCQDKAEFSEETEEGEAVETTTGKILGLEEKHYMSPKDKYQLAKKVEENTFLRTEDEYGYFYYFTNEELSEDSEPTKRYAVFLYNTEYRLDKYTLNILKSLDLEKRLVGGEYLKWTFSMEDWGIGGMPDFFKLYSAHSETEEEEKAVEEKAVEEKAVEQDENQEQEEEEEEQEDIYSSIYFQRDDIPLWCIKHRICFIALE